MNLVSKCFSFLAIALFVSAALTTRGHAEELVMIQNRTSDTIVGYYATNDLGGSEADYFQLSRSGGSAPVYNWGPLRTLDSQIGAGRDGMWRVRPVKIQYEHDPYQCYYMMAFVYADQSISYGPLQDFCSGGIAFYTVSVTR